MRAPLYIEITLTAGNISRCTLAESSGRSLKAEDAMQAISRLGQIRWTFIQRQEAVPLPAPSVVTPGVLTVVAPDIHTIIPRRITPVGKEQVSSWPRLHRAVFGLADGTKSVVRIAEILAIPPGPVNQVLRELQTIGIIVLESQDGKKRT